jgi:hypothetical protein
VNYSRYYREQADQAKSAAEASNLPNIREQQLTAAAKWSQMAERAEDTEARKASDRRS